MSSLLKTQVDDVYAVLKRNFPAAAKTLDPFSVKTEADANAFIAAGYEVIHRDPPQNGGQR